MEKIYRVQMNSKGMPNFATAEEIPQGKWIFDIYDSRGVNVCSECGVKIVGYGEDIPFPNCPYCLARMKGADDE